MTEPSQSDARADWDGDPKEVAVIIPTLNAGPYLDAMISGLGTQNLPPSSVLVVDSGSNDATVERFRDFGAEVVGLGGRAFNHGGTRRYATELRPDARFYIMLTHDAVPAGPNCFKAILRAFGDSDVGMAYGRQLPRPAARAIERHARVRNYPEESDVRNLTDRGRLGIKTIFCSDSFAAYRAEALRAVGGFPGDCYFAEDQHVAGKMLMQGLKLAYCADARVIHSHDYSIVDDFKRYFDIGVWHRKDAWLVDAFGRVEGEGLRFMRSELGYLARQNMLSIPSAILRAFAKYAGYRLGLQEERLSARLKKRLAMQSFYWAQQIALEKPQ